MDEIRWASVGVNWTLYRDAMGLWVAFNSVSESHKTMDKENMELWLTGRGLRTGEIETLFRDAEKNGEAAIIISHVRGPHY